MPDNSLAVSVWKKLGDGLGWAKAAELTTYSNLSIEPRHNQPGPWSLDIPVGAQLFTLTKKHLVTFDFRGTRFTGTIDDFGAKSGEFGEPLLSVVGTDALSWLGDPVGWPTPAQPLDQQDSVRWYATGPAETVLRDFIVKNLIDRLGYEVDAPASAGRGDNIEVDSPFLPVLPIVREKANMAGIGVKLGLVNTTSSARAVMRLQFYVPADKAARVVLSQQVGTLRSWSQSDKLPESTRVIVQAAKEQQKRTVSSVTLASSSISTAPGVRNESTRQVSAVGVDANTITTSSAHDLGTGDIINFTVTGGSLILPKPLEKAVDYHAIKIDNNTLKVATTRRNANAGKAINLTTNGSGTISVVRVTFSQIPNRFRTGDIVTFTGGTPPAPLESDVAYHVIRVDENTFKVALTRRRATQGTAVTLTSIGSGTITVTESTRRYRQVVSVDAEDEWGRKRESVIEGQADENTTLVELGQQHLTETESQRGFELESTEAEGQRFGTHFGLGDLVTVAPLTTVSNTQPLGGVKVTAAPDTGVTFVLLPGNPDATRPMFGQAAIIRGLRQQASQVEED